MERLASFLWEWGDIAIAFQEKVRPVWDGFIEANGDELVNKIVKLGQ
jgi:hypothetical protein